MNGTLLYMHTHVLNVNKMFSQITRRFTAFKKKKNHIAVCRSKPQAGNNLVSTSVVT